MIFSLALSTYMTCFYWTGDGVPAPDGVEDSRRPEEYKLRCGRPLHPQSHRYSEANQESISVRIPNIKSPNR